AVAAAVDVGRDVALVGLGEGRDEGPGASAGLRALEQVGGVALVVAADQAVLVVQGGAVDGEPVGGAQLGAVPGLDAEDGHGVVRGGGVLPALGLRVAEVGL